LAVSKSLNALLFTILFQVAMRQALVHNAMTEVGQKMEDNIYNSLKLK